MRFRNLLLPLIRLCQFSGLCPISVYGSKAISPLLNKRKRFATLTAAIFVVQMLMCIYTFSDSGSFIDWSRSKMFSYTNLFVFFTVRLHVAVVLIESYVKRTIQCELLEKFDEIDEIFSEKLKLKSNDDQLRRRFRQFLIVWIVKLVVINLIVLLIGISTTNWRIINVFALTFAPLYTNTLFYAQLKVYLDVVKYNIETINDCLAKLRDASPNWIWLDRKPVPATETMDVPQQLIYLRICYSKTWEASVLINQCVRWSLLLGFNNEFVFSIVNLYSILYIALKLPFAMNSTRLLLRVSWTGLNVSHFIMLSMICEQILEQVSYATRYL